MVFLIVKTSDKDRAYKKKYYDKTKNSKSKEQLNSIDAFNLRLLTDSKFRKEYLKKGK